VECTDPHERGSTMIAIEHDGRSDSVDRRAPSAAVAGIVHGLVFVLPLWAFAASVVVAVSVR
jgi:hypothetical protein